MLTKAKRRSILGVAAVTATAVMCTILILSLVAPLPVGYRLLAINFPQEVQAQGPVSTNGMAYAQINKSGCIVRNGNCQIRLDFYLEPEDERYKDTYLYVVDTASPEYLAGYTGKVNPDGTPVNQVQYDEWWNSLPRVWQNTPFHTHFIYLPATFTEEDIKA